jgi:DNA topoisomerase 2-associated protein PAT1
MFAALGAGRGRDDDDDVDALLGGRGELSAAVTVAAPSPQPASAPRGGLGSIALGGLLAATPSPGGAGAAAFAGFGGAPARDAPMTLAELERQMAAPAPAPFVPPPLPGFSYAAPPPGAGGPPPPGFGGPPPPGYGPPPPGMMPPGFGGPPPPMPPGMAPGVYTPEMIMAQQAHIAAQMHAAAQAHAAHAAAAAAAAQPAPPLGAGPPRAPRPAPGATPPPPPPSAGPYASLALRLRALNLAERPEEAPRPPPARRPGRPAPRYMAPDEVDAILAMQWRPLHAGHPYGEDYYYQAFLHAHYGARNARRFAPEHVRALAPTARAAAGEIAHVRLDGLGRVPFSNIRRPRPLMDVVSAPGAGAEAEGEENAGAEGGEAAAAGAARGAAPRRLEQEPMLAARIMIEDCEALLLDVQDIDRIFAAAAAAHGAPDHAAALRQRRALLVAGLAASLRLPDAPVPDAGAGAAAVAGDGVFMRLMALPKGRALAARALRVLHPPAEVGAEGEPNLRMLWAVLRNARALFAPPAASGGAGGKVSAPTAADRAGAAAKVAAAAADALARVAGPAAACDALAAALAGDLDAGALDADDPAAALLPLAPPPEAAGAPWLGDALAALLRAGARLGLGAALPRDAADAEAGAAWAAGAGRLAELALAHVEVLAGAACAAAGDGDAAGVAEVRALAPAALFRALAPHCAPAQAARLQAAMAALGL